MLLGYHNNILGEVSKLYIQIYSIVCNSGMVVDVVDMLLFIQLVDGN